MIDRLQPFGRGWVERSVEPCDERSHRRSSPVKRVRDDCERGAGAPVLGSNGAVVRHFGHLSCIDRSAPTVVAKDELQLIEVEVSQSCPLDQGIHDAPIVAVYLTARGQEIYDRACPPFLRRLRQKIGDGVEAQVQHALEE